MATQLGHQQKIISGKYSGAPRTAITTRSSGPYAEYVGSSGFQYSVLIKVLPWVKFRVSEV